MSIVAKILVGSAVVAGVGTIVAIAASKEDKVETKADVKVSVNETKEDPKKEKSIIKRIKTYVTKKFIKFLGWAVLHMNQIEAASAVIGLVSGGITIVGAIRDFKNGNDLQEKLDDMNSKLDTVIATQYLTNKGQNHNNKVFATCHEFTAKASGVDMEKLEDELNKIDKEDGMAS